MSNLKNNNAQLEALIEQANALPIAITVDATLTQEGAAADAKATGDAITALNAQIAELPQNVVRYDEAQTLTEEEKAIARENIGADVEILNSNLVNGEAVGSLRTVGSKEESSSPWYKLGEYSFVQGYGTQASGRYSHAEGCGSGAHNNGSHAQGYYCSAGGFWSHAEGENTATFGTGSHAEGYHTVAGSGYQHVQGKYNIEDQQEQYAHIVGNGWQDEDSWEEIRSNIHTLDWDGNAWFAGDVYVGSSSGVNRDEGSQKLITQADMEAYVNEAILGGAW